MRFVEQLRRRRNSSRRARFQPTAEGLEPRLVLSGLAVGVNLQSNQWYNNDPIWTDLHNLMGTWQLDGQGVTTLTADGYPTSGTPSISILTAGYPAGYYEFSFTGAGTPSFSGAGQLVGTLTVSNGVTTGTVLVNPAANSGQVDLTMSGLNASDPMDNFHFMLPGYGNGTTSEPMYTPQFLQALAPFSDIRFMNWGSTNNSTVANWSDRVQPTALITDGSGGVPYEDMIALANAAHKDMWINIPAEATPQFVQSLAQLIHSQLNPSLNVYVEYSNEIWNYGFAAYSQVASIAASNPVIDHSLSQYQQVADQAAYSTVVDGQIFNQVFGTATSRVRPILGGQFAWDQFQTYELQFIQQKFGTPSKYIYAQAVAPYLDGGDSNTPNLTLDQLFSDLQNNLNGWWGSQVHTDAALDQQYGVPMVAYEGGQGLMPGTNGANFAVMSQAQSDPRMYALYREMMSTWSQGGGQLFNAYQLDGPSSIWGFWGMFPTVSQIGGMKYNGLLSSFLPAGDSNGDGVVNFADFQTLAANYDTTNANWMQGDFNGDNAVNGVDLNLLRSNITPSGFTPTQFAQQALFGQAATVDTPTALDYSGYGVTPAGSLASSGTTGTVQVNQDGAGNPISLGGVTYAKGLGFTGGSQTTLALNGQFTEFDATIGMDASAAAGSSAIFQVIGDAKILYQSPLITAGSAATPIAINVTGIQKLTLVVEAGPGTFSAGDLAAFGDARVVSTANFGSTTPDTLTWTISQNGKVISTQAADSFVLPAIAGTYNLIVTATNAQGQTGSASTTVTVVPNVASATFLGTDTSNKGVWRYNYGAEGVWIAGQTPSVPPGSNGNVSVTGASTSTWSSSTTDVRALQQVSGVDPAATAWFGSSFTINVNLNDGQMHEVALYAVDWDNQGRIEQVQVIDPSTGRVLDTQTLSNFTGGTYLKWQLSGSVQIRVTDISGSSAVISGVFVDAAPAPSPSVSSTFVSSDTTTQGSWIGKYGTLGSNIEGQVSTLPSYAQVGMSNALTWTWASSTTDVRGLQVPGGNGRTAMTWFNNTFTIDVNLTDGQVHDLSLYAVDWDNQGRSEQVQVIDPATGKVLDTETLSNFYNGAYLTWAISGHVQIKVTMLTGPNAVVSGLFLQ